MSPSTIDIGGLKIAVYQNRVRGLPIIFVHGNSLSASTFTLQFNSTSLNHYRLIAFDLPGHGESERSKNPEQDYSPITFIKILVELCTKLNAANAVLVGHSLGGHIALNALEYLPNVRGLVTFGATPLTVPPRLDLAYFPNSLLGLIFKPDLSHKEMEQVASGFVAKGAHVPSEINDSIGCTDPLVRLYVGKVLTSGQTNDEVKIISSRKVPFAIFHGEGDQLVDANYFNLLPRELLWKEQIHLIPNAGHAPQLENPVVFNSLLNKFIENPDHIKS